MTGSCTQALDDSSKINFRLQEMRTCSSTAVYSTASKACNACGSKMYCTSTTDESLTGSLSRRPLLPMRSLTVSIEEEQNQGEGNDGMNENDVFLAEQQSAMVTASAAIQVIDPAIASSSLCANPPTYNELADANHTNQLLNIASGATNSPNASASMRQTQESNRFQYMHQHFHQQQTGQSTHSSSKVCKKEIASSTSTTTATATTVLVAGQSRGVCNAALSGSVISIQPHRKCGDASTTIPSQAAVRKLTRTRSNLDALNGLVFVLSAVYAKLVVILGLCFPMAEVISHRIPIGWYEGFYLYLYLGTCLFFILYSFTLS